MDRGAVDALTRNLVAAPSRRTALVAAAGGGLAAALAGFGYGADAKKKQKKCKKPRVKCGKKCCPKGQTCIAGACAVPCTFSTVGSVMTLQANCTTATPIEVPNERTLDGNGKTIRLIQVGSGPGDAGIVARSGSAHVANLAVIGTGAEGNLLGFGAVGLKISGTAGSVVDVSISDTLASAIILEATGGQEVTLARVSVARAGGDGVIASGIGGGAGIRVDIDDSEVSDVFGVGVSVVNAVGSVAISAIHGASTGIQVDSGSNLSVDGNDISDVDLGVVVFGATAAVSGNTIVGRGTQPGAGVAYDLNSGGAASGNAISNFVDADPGVVSCGIFVEDGSTAVIGANTFPDPGNEQDVCDNLP